jgi:hypothetical protein
MWVGSNLSPVPTLNVPCKTAMFSSTGCQCGATLYPFEHLYRNAKGAVAKLQSNSRIARSRLCLVSPSARESVNVTTTEWVGSVTVAIRLLLAKSAGCVAALRRREHGMPAAVHRTGTARDVPPNERKKATSESFSASVSRNGRNSGSKPGFAFPPRS